LTGAIVRVKHPGIVSGARHILAELRAPDSLTPLVIDSLVLPMMATAVRVGALRRPERARPAWLSRAQEIIHARFRERLLLDEIAAAVDVTPWHLARAFRRDFGMTIGEYARSLRLNWALDRLAKTSMPISAVAVAAGYTDQSHLTRACTAATGVGPAQYRRASRNA
jgi:AraC family transcriptional regulator